MVSWSSRLLSRVRRDRGSALSMIEYIADDIRGRALQGGMSGEEWEAFALELVETRPEMATMFNIANGILLSLSEADFNGRIGDFMRTLLEREDPRGAIAHRVASMEGLGWVVTNSYSSTVLSVLKALEARGGVDITVAESLPLGEGTMFAEALVSSGLKAEIISDSMSFAWMDKADAFICGADAIGPGGVFNKMGSRALACAAHMASKPVLVVCDSMKICPVPVKKHVLTKEQVARRMFRSSQAFEDFPLSLVTAVVTENGVLTAGELEGMFRDWVVDPRLLP